VEKAITILTQPDDAEGSCIGTAAKWAREEKMISYFVLINEKLDSRGRDK